MTEQVHFMELKFWPITCGGFTAACYERTLVVLDQRPHHL